MSKESNIARSVTTKQSQSIKRLLYCIRNDHIKHFLLFTFAFSLIFSACSGTKVTKNTKDLKKTKYFRVLADADDDYIFVKLQDDLGIDPKMERYTVVVDIRSNEPSMQTVLFGDDTNPLRFQWSKLSEQVRNGLVNWTGSNKENLE